MYSTFVVDNVIIVASLMTMRMLLFQVKKKTYIIVLFLVSISPP